MERGALWATVHGVAKSRTRPSSSAHMEQRAALSRIWLLLLGLHWPTWTGSLGFRPPLTPVAKVRPSPVLQSSAHAPRGLQPCDASGLGKGRASQLQGAEKPSQGPGSSWGGRDAGGLEPWQVQLLEEGAQRRHKVACVPAPAQRQALLLMLPVRRLHSHCRLPGCEPKSRVCLAETPGCGTWGGSWRKYWLPDWTRRG